LDTALIAREQSALFDQEPVGLALAAAAAVAQALTDERVLQTADPFGWRDNWRSHGDASRRFAFEFHDEPIEAELKIAHDGGLRLQIGEWAGPLQFATTPQGLDVHFAGQHSKAVVFMAGESCHVFCPHGATQIRRIDLLAHAGEATVEGGRLTAPMPGVVVSFAVKPGDAVRKGQALAVMQAMKMEHTIAAPADGVVAELLYTPGDQVLEGAQLLRLEAI
jgi:3-methylcrotonyl-CoA carboxylase alpha subunit